MWICLWTYLFKAAVSGKTTWWFLSRGRVPRVMKTVQSVSRRSLQGLLSDRNRENNFLTISGETNIWWLYLLSGPAATNFPALFSRSGISGARRLGPHIREQFAFYFFRTEKKSNLSLWSSTLYSLFLAQLETSLLLLNTCEKTCTRRRWSVGCGRFTSPPVFGFPQKGKDRGHYR